MEFNTRFIKAYHKIPQAFRPNADFALVYYVKAFDESIGFLLREKDSQTLEAAMSATVKIEKNIMAAKNVLAPLSRLFDPQGRISLEPKKEKQEDVEELPSRFVDLLQDLSNKVVKLEKNLQNS